MAANAVWHRSQQPPFKSVEEELLVFGYSCKMFRDDEKATFIDEGKHLIPWMGNDSVMIDRYDVRGYLHDLTPYEAKPTYELDQVEAEEEMLCNEERYLALRADMSEEELYHEEELKRLRAAVASDGAYHEIGFTYELVENSSEQMQQNINKEEPNEEPYVAPVGLTLPKGMQVPSNMKIHAIIEKTAFFISQQGGQMEIIIKMKQSDNPQFAFMNFDNPLHPYYKFLVQELKAGRYKPVPDKKSKEPDDEHHDEHYLHPSLVSRKAEDIPKFTVPSINFRRTGDDSYSLLVKNLRQQIKEDTPQNSPTTEVETASLSPARDDSQISTSDSDDSLETESYSNNTQIIPPPPDIKPIIDKMAEYVGKNGEDFETIVKSKHDKRFEFLNQTHKYYNYYIYRRNSAAASLCPEAPIQPEKHEQESQPPNAPASSSSASIQMDSCAASTQLSPDHSRISSSIADSEDSQMKSYSVANLSSAEHSPKDEDCYEPDTTDTVKSSGSENSPKHEPKVKTITKVIKGPISFSLKAKELESQSEKGGKRTPLLLDDSEGEEEKMGEDLSSDTDKRRKTRREQDTSASTRNKKSDEEKPKKPSAEEIEAKLAEEKIKSKIMAAAREKLAQQKRDKQLQLERKQKAALFLKMLQNRKLAAANELANTSDKSKGKPLESPSTKNGLADSPSTPDFHSPGRKEALSSYPPSPLSSFRQAVTWSSPSNSNSDVSDHEIETIVNERLQVTSTLIPAKEKPKKKEEKSSIPDKSHKLPSKSSHKSSKSKKRHRSKSRSPSRRHQRLRSPSRKEKKLPSAYAIERTSRSKSRSPKRYSLHSRARSPLHWSRYRP